MLSWRTGATLPFTFTSMTHLLLSFLMNSFPFSSSFQFLFHTHSLRELSVVFQPRHSCQDPRANLSHYLRSTFSRLDHDSSGSTVYCEPYVNVLAARPFFPLTTRLKKTVFFSTLTLLAYALLASSSSNIESICHCLCSCFRETAWWRARVSCVMTKLTEPHFQLTRMQRIEPCNKCARSCRHETTLDGQKECAAQQQGNMSILVNVPTRQWLRKRKRVKSEPSLQQHNVSARKTKEREYC